MPMTRKIRYCDYGFIGKIFKMSVEPLLQFFYICRSLGDIEVRLICKLYN